MNILYSFYIIIYNATSCDLFSSLFIFIILQIYMITIMILICWLIG